MSKQEEYQVRITADEVTLDGDLRILKGAKGIVVFAHGSGSSRHSPRNSYVAQVLNDAGLATLLFDLLTVDEETEDMVTRELRFNINLLTQRLVATTKWLQDNTETSKLKIGYFGASTGAAAAIIAAAELPEIISTVVSRGGRPDLAAEALQHIKAPTLFIVGGDDFPVIEINQKALVKIEAEKKLVIIPGATHLFEEPGALEEVASLATNWFINHIL